MATVELKNVVIHYAISPFEGVWARVRTYVAGAALKEESVNVQEDALVARGGEKWTGQDLVAELGDHMLAVDALDTLEADPAFTAEVQKLRAKKASIAAAEALK